MMQFTTKTQSVTQVLLALAQQSSHEPVAVAILSQYCGMSEHQTDMILQQCCQWGLVDTNHDGYVLAWPPQDISLRCIVQVAESPSYKCQCEGKSEDTCGSSFNCRTRRIRNVAQIILDDALESISLLDFIHMK